MSIFKLSRRSFILGATAFAGSLMLPKSFAREAQFEPFSFAYVTDTHLVNGLPDSYELTQESQLFLQDAVKQINGMGVNFVVFGGDQVQSPGKDEANWNLFCDVVQGLAIPWYFVLGEEDSSGTIPTDKIKLYGPDWKRRDFPGDKPYWSFNYSDNVHLIGLDTSRANNTEGFISPEQLEWLDADLKENKSALTVVFSHHPLLTPPPFDGGPPWENFLVPQGANVREILNNSSAVKLAVSGHLHTSKVEREKDIWYVSCPSLDVYPCEFRKFTVSPEKIDIETYQIDYPALIRKARTELAGSRIAFEFNSKKPADFVAIAEGDKLDRNVSLPLSSNKQPESLKPSKHTKPKAPPPKGKEKDNGKSKKVEKAKAEEQK